MRAGLFECQAVLQADGVNYLSVLLWKGLKQSGEQQIFVDGFAFRVESNDEMLEAGEEGVERLDLNHLDVDELLTKLDPAGKRFPFVVIEQHLPQRVCVA